MKGVSKYGQFIVEKVTDENSSNENSKNIVKPPTHSTKFTIKDGKLQPPLRVRSHNVPSENPSKHGRSIKSYFEVRPNDVNNNNNNKATKNLIAPKPKKEKFHVYGDDENDNDKGKKTMAVALGRTMSSSTTLTDEMSLLQPSCSNFLAPYNPAYNLQRGLKMKRTQSIRSIDEMKKSTVSQSDVSGQAESELFATPANSSGFFSVAESTYFGPVTESEKANNPNVNDSIADSAMVSAASSSSDVPIKRVKRVESESDCYRLDDDPGHLLKIYDADMYAYLRWREQQFFLKSREFLSKQQTLTALMRENTIDWFMDVVLSNNLSPCTYFLAVATMDRLLCVLDCPDRKIQLLGSGCLFVASKMEDGEALPIADLVMLTNSAYTMCDIRRMERVVLRKLQFDMQFPTADHFAYFFIYLHPINNKKLDDNIRMLMRYMLELAAFFYEFVTILPSHIGAAAYVLARYVREVDDIEYERTMALEAHNKRCEKAGWIQYDERPTMLLTNAELTTLDDHCWPAELEVRTGIERAQLSEPLRQLARVFELSKDPSLQHSIYNKYQHNFCGYLSSNVMMPMRLPFQPPRQPDIIIPVPPSNQLAGETPMETKNASP